MPIMFRTVLAALLVLSTAHARADFVDWYNGVSLGAQLPKHGMSYASTPPDTANKVQLIDFWATWCESCRKSIPELNALQKKFDGKGLVVIGVTQESRETVAPFLEKLSIDYALAYDGEPKLHTSLKIKALPYAIFVDRSGKIVWRGQPAAISEKLIESLLAK